MLVELSPLSVVLGATPVAFHMDVEGEIGPYFGYSPVEPTLLSEGEQSLGIETDQFHPVSLGLFLRSLFLDDATVMHEVGRSYVVADRAEPVEVFLVRPQNGEAPYGHGYLLSVVRGTSTVTGGGATTSRASEGSAA